MKLLAPLEEKYKIHWNNRLDRHPESYDSYSELINETVATSPTEIVVLINDRVVPKTEEVVQMINHLEEGFAVSTMFSVGYMSTSKELFRTIGWWDQRYYGGGYEDDDFVIRLRGNDVAYYESASGEYDKSFLSPLRAKGGEKCARSLPHFRKKWRISTTTITRKLPEEKYEKWDKLVGPKRDDISRHWKKWKDSIIGVDFPPFGTSTALKGESRTKWFCNYDNGREFRKVLL
jgi:hypothetical protein